LPSRYSTILFMYYVEGLSCSQISAEIERPLNTVTTRLRRGRALLKKQFDMQQHLPYIKQSKKTYGGHHMSVMIYCVSSPPTVSLVLETAPKSHIFTDGFVPWPRGRVIHCLNGSSTSKYEWGNAMDTEWEYCEMLHDRVNYFGEKGQIPHYLVGDEAKTVWYALGKAKWELVGIATNQAQIWYTFKRPVQPGRKIDDAI
jgi:hypothetical protein